MLTFDNDIKECITVLNNGGIILYPTDTIWGIGCDATNAKAVKRIFQLKKREEKKSMIILVSNEKMIHEYVATPSSLVMAFLVNQVRPTTAIFEKAIHLPPELVNENESIAIRIVKDDFCKQLINQVRRPIVSTSANISGEDYPKNFIEISVAIKNGVDYIVQHRQDDLKVSLPSSIIKLNSSNEIEILR